MKTSRHTAAAAAAALAEIDARQERQLAQLEGHDQQLQSFLCEAVTQRKRKPDSDSNVIRVQLQRPRQLVRPWAKTTQSSSSSSKK